MLSRGDFGEPLNEQVALAWVLNNPAVSAPIVGASRAHHLEEAVQALQGKLAAEEIRRLEQAYRPHRVPVHE